jgi:hypothetical protein
MKSNRKISGYGRRSCQHCIVENARNAKSVTGYAYQWNDPGAFPPSRLAGGEPTVKTGADKTISMRQWGREALCPPSSLRRQFLPHGGFDHRGALFGDHDRGALVLVEVTEGITEASMTRRSSGRGRAIRCRRRSLRASP